MNWQEEMRTAIDLHTKLKTVDINELYEYHAPNPGASLQELARCEQALGYQLDPQYRGFLERANGWEKFYHDFDLMSAGELVAGAKLDHARKLLPTLEPLEEVCECRKDQLMVFGASLTRSDLFLVAKSNARRPGRVFWFAGYLVEEYEDFLAYFHAMMAFNRRRHDKLIDEHGLGLPKLG
jgi:hypothetical protein